MSTVMLVPVSQALLQACDYSHAQAAAIAAEIVDRSGLATDLDWSLTARTGAPRRLSWRTLLIVFVTAAIMRKQMHVSEVSKVAAALFKRGLIPTPTSYHQLWDGIDYIATALDAEYVVTAHSHPLEVNPNTGEVHDCPQGCAGGVTVSREVFAARLCTVSAFPTGNEVRSTTFALDSTDLETAAARRSWERVPDIDTSSD